jgi:hypothetical protein
MSLPSDTNPYTSGTDVTNVVWWPHISPLNLTIVFVFKIETSYFTDYLCFL